ncbi:GNAT family N-acetyltransferase [Kineococcus sp. SYSU DK003]|uniref:GNAT family N-acetyltransferase n=1 Tax=Kineococcus sp. SYSU DK003 TaxID=3383124 RepID=UPI003D7CB426
MDLLQRHVRPLALTDVTATAELHARCLRQGLFPRLGPEFLARWHATFTDTDSAWAAVCVDDRGDQRSTVVGYVLVSVDPPRHRRHAMVVHRGPLVRAASRGMARRPHVAFFFVRTRLVRYGRRALRTWIGKRTPAPRARSGAPAVLQALVTDERHRHEGVATELLGRALQEISRRGVREVVLLTQEQEAVALYERFGFETTGVRVRDGAEWTHMRRGGDERAGGLAGAPR